MLFRLIFPLLVACKLAAAKYAVMDVFTSNEDCALKSPVQLSLLREVGVCWNLPEDIPASFPFSTKKSYRIDSCVNDSPFLSSTVSVYDEVDCAGPGTEVNMDNTIPDSCMENMRVSCQDEPVAITNKWPAIEMWLPTTNDGEPDCSPSLHPPVVMSVRPECALVQNAMGDNFAAMKADCSVVDEMEISIYKDVNSCPNPDILPFWSLKVDANSCQLVGDAFDYDIWSPECMCRHMADKMGVTMEQRMYILDLLARSSVKFRCY